MSKDYDNGFASGVQSANDTIYDLRSEVARLTRALEQERLEKGQAVLALMNLRRTSVVAEENVTLTKALEEARAEAEIRAKDRDDYKVWWLKEQSEVSRLRGQVEGAWRAGVEAAAKVMDRASENAAKHLTASSLIPPLFAAQAATIRALPPPSAPADDTDTNHKEK